MNKKLMTLAVAGALAAPAAALAQVQIFGRANLGFDNYATSGATQGVADLKARNRVYDSASRLGFRGSEDLGGGLKALFQIESGVNLDTGSNLGQSGAANASSGWLGSRDSYVGLEGSWGRVTLGRQSVFWTNGTIVQTGANYVNTDLPMATVGGGFGRVLGIGTRINNTVMYSIPTTQGFGGYVSYSPNSETSQGQANTDADIKALRVTYEGRVKVQFDWAVNQAASGGAFQQKLTGLKLGVGFPYAPGAQIAAIFGQNQNVLAGPVTNFAIAGDTVKQNMMLVSWEHIFGNIQALAMVGRLNKATGCNGTNTFTGNNGCQDTEATSFHLGAKYLLSKRTGVYATYNKTNNKANQVLDYTAASLTSSTTFPVGASPRLIAVGVIHNF
jgi:predicted porin